MILQRFLVLKMNDVLQNIFIVLQAHILIDIDFH